MKKLALVLVVVIAIGVALTGYAIFTKDSNKISVKPAEENPSTIVSANAAEPKIKKTEVHSADGESNALLEENDGTYTLYSCDITCTNKLLIYKTTPLSGETLQLPFNAWSPHNKYVFLVKKGNGTASYLVFNSSGEPFASGKDFIDVTPFFVEKHPELELKDVTGWDSDTLLHVLSSNGEKNGPSFWFEVPSGALIQLGSR